MNSVLIMKPPTRFTPARAGVWNTVENLARGFELRLGTRWTWLVAGLVLTLLAAIYITPAYEPVNQGTWFSSLSEHPLSLENREPIRMRVLSPLIGHALFLRGRFYFIFPLLVLIVFNGAIYWYGRREGLSEMASWGLAVLMAFSMPTFYQLHFAGYSDSLSFLLLFLCLVFSQHVTIWAPLFMLAMFNHEIAIFFVPVLLWQYVGREMALRRWLAGAAAVSLALLPVALFRWFIERHSAVQYSESSYLNIHNILKTGHSIIEYFPLGFFMAYRLFWVLPIFAIVIQMKRKRYFEVVSLALPIFCALAQLLVATDTSRLIGFAFPSIIGGAMVIYDWTCEKEKFAARLWSLIGLDLLVPAYYVGQAAILPLIPLPISLILCALHVDAWHLYWI
jgi:hypothetical protein